MPIETLSWANQTVGVGGTPTPGQQLADFTGIGYTSNGGAGSIVVQATLLDGTDVNAAQGILSGGAQGINGTAQTFPAGAVSAAGTVLPPGLVLADAQVLNTGELTTNGNYAGAVANSALALRNLEGGATNGYYSGAGLTHTVSLQLDFTTNDPANYSNGVDSVSFWISDIDKATFDPANPTAIWDDQILITAYDTAGNALPAGTITFANVGTNVIANSTGVPATLGTAALGATVDTAANGSVQVVVNDPTVAVGRVVIQYNNLGTGPQGIFVSDLTMTTMPPPPCFTAGTLILTENGEVAIEDLAEGDLVVTAGNGLVPVRWIGQRTVSATGAFAPIVITKGALGNTRDLMVSPAHRMVVSDPRVAALFSEDEVLVAAKSLVDGDRIYRKTGGMVTYFHILFDEHEVVFANGAPSESLYLGQSALAAFSEDTQAEVLALFPELDGKLPAAGEPARPVLNASEAALLAS